MDRDLWSVSIVVVLFLIFTGLLAATGGVEDESHLWIRNIDIKAEAVGEGEANITAIIMVEHEGGAVSDVELHGKVYDGETGLLLNEKSVPAGTIEDQSSETRLSFTLPREGSLRLVIELFEGDELLTTQETRISGLSTLDVKGDLLLDMRDVDFAVNGSIGDRTVVDATAYIDNLKPADTPQLVMLIKAEDSETGLLVDKTEVDIGSLNRSGTSIRSASLKLLNERDHAIDLKIWSGDKIVAEGYGWIGLSPFGNRTEFIPVEGTVVEKEPEISLGDFSSRPTAEDVAEEWTQYDKVGGMGSRESRPQAPGFSAICAIFALLIVIVIRRTKNGR
ncbi:MAG TPA: hypothetical protein ENL17_01015 [Candidatus Methanoperedenaceae archaeon]|nr:hypothetical protein [Candidatus Methanoperedenaceae archaeon]